MPTETTVKYSRSTEPPEAKIAPDLQWRCTECKTVLGYLSRDRETVRIKYKDLLVHICNGEVSRNCRFCGAWNNLHPSEWEEKK